MQKVKKGMSLRGYAFPDTITFFNKVKDIFGIDLRKNTAPLVKLDSSPEPSPTLWAVRNSCLLIHQEELPLIYPSYNEKNQLEDLPFEKWDTSNFQHLVALNKLLISADASQLKPVDHYYPELLTSLLQDFGYTGNPAITKMKIEAISDMEDGRQTFLQYCYGWLAGQNVLGVRTNVLEAMLKYNPDVFIHTGWAIRELKLTNTPARPIAQLLDAAIRAGITGFTEELCTTDKKLMNEIRKNNAYGMEALQAYMKNSCPR
ncbi:hypothetical protein [Chitinophaga jiangningensis]|uniref:hypothetical protein n=1 Tax=Chitinophaga jiangningensis TaxID=1419482 RepID=UPI001160156F|nr:hypothetical protein [Chitinophaga jiangningensis]